MALKRLPKNPSRLRSESEQKLLKAIGRQVHKDLADKGKPVEWLAFEAETARSTVRRIFDGDGNIGIATLDRISRALGYADVIEFFKRLQARS